MTILRAQVESNEQGLCRCGRRATSKLSYAKEMDQRQDASSPSPPSSPPTDGSYQTPVTESVTRLVPVPEDVQLPSPTSSEEVLIPIPPPRASTPGCEVSGQHCWTRRKFDKTPGAGASGRFVTNWHFSRSFHFNFIALTLVAIVQKSWSNTNLHSLIIHSAF